jgi:hypothetical protein
MKPAVLGLLGCTSAYGVLAALAAAAFRVGLSAPEGPATTKASFVPVNFVVAGAVAQLYAFLFMRASIADLWSLSVPCYAGWPSLC